jgi:ligand-binding SRPBCC domain-containing protein
MRALTERVEIHATKEEVWDALADFGGVADWAPYMKSYHLIGDLETGIGTRRGMRHAWGFRFEEVVTHWDEGLGYSFDVFKAPYPMKNVQESWATGMENGFPTVTTRVQYEMKLGPLGLLLDWMLVRFVVKREMRAGLRGLKLYVES